MAPVLLDASNIYAQEDISITIGDKGITFACLVDYIHLAFTHNTETNYILWIDNSSHVFLYFDFLNL